MDASGICCCCRQWLSLAWSRPASTTLAPSRTKRDAMASPMAPVAPVTTAVLPARERRAISRFVPRISVVGCVYRSRACKTGSRQASRGCSVFVQRYLTSTSQRANHLQRSCSSGLHLAPRPSWPGEIQAIPHFAGGDPRRTCAVGNFEQASPHARRPEISCSQR